MINKKNTANRCVRSRSVRCFFWHRLFFCFRRQISRKMRHDRFGSRGRHIVNKRIAVSQICGIGLTVHFKSITEVNLKAADLLDGRRAGCTCRILYGNGFLIIEGDSRFGICKTVLLQGSIIDMMVCVVCGNEQIADRDERTCDIIAAQMTGFVAYRDVDRFKLLTLQDR